MLTDCISHPEACIAHCIAKPRLTDCRSCHKACTAHCIAKLRLTDCISHPEACIAHCIVERRLTDCISHPEACIAHCIVEQRLTDCISCPKAYIAHCIVEWRTTHCTSRPEDPCTFPASLTTPTDRDLRQPAACPTQPDLCAVPAVTGFHRLDCRFPTLKISDACKHSSGHKDKVQDQKHTPSP